MAWEIVDDKWGWFLLVVFFVYLLGLIQSVHENGFSLLTWVIWGQTLWEWADLLLIPTVLLVGGFLLQRTERKTDREIADKERDTDREIG